MTWMTKNCHQRSFVVMNTMNERTSIVLEVSLAAGTTKLLK